MTAQANDSRGSGAAAAVGCPNAAPGPQQAPDGCPVSARARAFDPFEPACMQDPAAYLRLAREEEPVFYSPELGHWVVTRYADVKAVFRDHILFSPAIALEKITPAGPEVTAILQRYGFAMSRTMVKEDEPDHMERRRLLMDAFLPERLAAYEPMVRTRARQAMDRFFEKGRATWCARCSTRSRCASRCAFSACRTRAPSSCASSPLPARSTPGDAGRRRSSWRSPRTWGASGRPRSASSTR
jgi:cytochrome P450